MKKVFLLLAVLALTFSCTPEDGVDGVDGTNGINGIDGVDGIDGINGVDGQDGIDGTNGRLLLITEEPIVGSYCVGATSAKWINIYEDVNANGVVDSGDIHVLEFVACDV